MSNTLLAAVRLYADAHADHTGVAQTPVPGLTLIRATSKTALRYDVQRPLVCLVVQGSKHVSIGRQSFTFNAGDSLLIMADVPTASQITRADASAPYYSLVLDLDPAVITDLTTEIAATGQTDHAALRCAQTDDEVANAALQLLRLLARPEAIPLLQAQRLRDFHYWLLAGRHGPALRRIGLPNSHLQRIARAVAVLKAGYRQRLPVEHLASAAGMSVSSFHQNFRAVTSLTPLQFQKQLRLIEARRMMFAEGANASHAAFAVGYESVHQFSREYGRMFGLPPARDRDQHSDRLQAIA